MKKIKFLLIIIMPLFLAGCFNNSEKIIEISTETQNIIKNYIKENISELSPEKESLGGKFYVTEINFQNLDTAIINYEDGHIALKAEAIFIVENENVEIINFELINEEEALITNEHLKCNNHDDCIPLPGCHPQECINKRYQNNYTQPELCTMIYDYCAAYEANDCICQQGICFNENLMNEECK